LPSLKGKMAAKKAEIIKLTAADLKVDELNLGLKGSPTQVRNIFAPEAKTNRTMLHGTPEEMVSKLVEDLLESKCL
jgi:electron transfer flavoprotein beta subunit